MDYPAPATPSDSNIAVTWRTVFVDDKYKPVKNRDKVGPDGLTKDQRYYRRKKLKLEEEQRKRHDQGLPPLPVPVRANRRKNVSPGVGVTVTQAPVMASPQADRSLPLTLFQELLQDLISLSTAAVRPGTLADLAEKSDLEQLGTKVKNLDWLLSIRAYTVTWSGSWGGVDQWCESIDGFYEKAKIQGQDEVDRCILAISRKASRGREILKELRTWVDASKPQDQVVLRTVLQEVWKIKMVVMTGVEYIDLRLSKGDIGYPGAAERLEELCVERNLASMEVLNEEQDVDTTEE